MINGLFETHINVTDLERSMAFYGEVLGLELGLLQEERRIAFYWLGGRGEAMLGLWERPELVQRQHFAFRSTVDDIRERVVPFLKGKGLAVHNFLEDDTERPLVIGWMPAIAKNCARVASSISTICVPPLATCIRSEASSSSGSPADGSRTIVRSVIPLPASAGGASIIIVRLGGSLAPPPIDAAGGWIIVRSARSPPPTGLGEGWIIVRSTLSGTPPPMWTTVRSARPGKGSAAGIDRLDAPGGPGAMWTMVLSAPPASAAGIGGLGGAAPCCGRSMVRSTTSGWLGVDGL